MKNAHRQIFAAIAVTAMTLTGCAKWEPNEGSPNPNYNWNSNNQGIPNPDGGQNPNPNPQPPGSTCVCNWDCQNVGSHQGMCVLGLCMILPSAPCSEAGSQAECPAGSRCWGLQGFSGSICWPDCAKYNCAGQCDTDGSCVPTDSMDCDYSCGTFCSCQPGDCPQGQTCRDGRCVTGTDPDPDPDPDPNPTGNEPGPGPGPNCTNLPPLECTGTASYCGEVVPFDPDQGPGYEDYPLNGETWSNQYRSYLRRDVMMAIKYATAKVACKAANWTYGNGHPMGLGDMSEANGDIPGTSIGQPGHPEGTHTNGFDIDVAYYQTTGSDNHLRAICDHYSGGQEAYHCVAPPDTLDEYRTALFIGALNEHPYFRVIGVDGQAGQILENALTYLCNNNWISASACNNIPLAFEVTNQNHGWYYFHHHHMHISFLQPNYPLPPMGQNATPMQCLIPGCNQVALQKWLSRVLPW